MKNKKSLLSLVIFALVLILGVGYAVVSSVDLTIGGTAGVKNASLKVDFESVADTKTNATVTHTLTQHAKEDKFTITDMELKETVTMVYTVANHETDVDADLTEKIALSNSNPNYFEVSYKINGNEIEAGGTTTVTVTVKLIKTPVTTAQGTTTVSLKLNAAPVDNSN